MHWYLCRGSTGPSPKLNMSHGPSDILDPYLALREVMPILIGLVVVGVLITLTGVVVCFVVYKRCTRRRPGGHKFTPI